MIPHHQELAAAYVAGEISGAAYSARARRSDHGGPAGAVRSRWPRSLRRRALLDMTASRAPETHQMDVNAVVSYNLRVIRERRGMTQQGVADRLAQLTGHRLPQASISAMERGFDGERRRRFDAHELYLLSVVFGVPLIYFFLPPLGEARHLADTGRPIHDLYAAVFGREHQVIDLDDRLAGLDPNRGVDIAAALNGNTSPTSSTWREDYRRWRDQRLREITRTCDGLDEAVHALGAVFDQARRAGIRSFVTNADEDR